ncbi:hypothetical protein GCM10027345_44850 [Hymenobacter daeguensis]
MGNCQVFEPGYLVLQNGDTLRGEVENRFWEEPPTEVRFRTTAAGQGEVYADGQLRNVVLRSGRMLQNETLPIDRNAETRVDFLPVKVVRKQQPERVLADVLLRGPASLLGITLHSTKHFFVQRPGQPWLELAANNYLLLDRIADANDYKSLLLRYFGDCEAATALLPTTDFTADGLRRVVLAFNRKCAGEAPAVPEIVVADAASRPRVAFRMGAVLGVRYNSLRLQGPAQATAVLNGLNIDGRLHAQAGGYFDLMSPGRRLAVHTTLLVSRFGNPDPVAFALAPGTLPGNFEWRGTQAGLQFGVRGFVPISTSADVLLGAGYELNGFWTDVSVFRYGSKEGVFIYDFVGGYLPYLEAGLRYNRLALTLNGRAYDSDYVIHFLDVPDQVYYTYQPWSLSLALSYRLNGDSDVRSQPGR